MQPSPRFAAPVAIGGLVIALLVTASPASAADCDTPPSHSISEVQGPGDTTPLEGEQVRVEGVVTGDFSGRDRLRGFFIQDDEPDDDPSTSEGLFVFAPRRAMEADHDLDVGDRVLVSGEAVEFFGLTELTRVSEVDVCGDGEIEPTEAHLPIEGDFEASEGMLLTFPQELTATETFNLGQFGEITVSAGGRLFQPTDGHGDTQEGNDARRLLIDDGSTRRDPRPVPYLPVRLGDTVRQVTGVMSYGFDSYRLQPTQKPKFTGANPRPESPAEVGGNVKVAAFNTLNWFTTLGERGARTEEEQERQLAKLVAAINGLDADVIGLMEIENNDKAIRVLIEELNRAATEDEYAAVEHPGSGADAIQVSMIYRRSTVRPSGDPITSDDEIFSRPPLMQRFKRTRGGEPFTAVVNHFKSKGCGGAEGDDRDQGDGQACYNATRVKQARALAGALADLPKPLVIGDLNAYADEDPIKEFAGSGYASLTRKHVANDERYSYVFFGQAGELDHALASKALAKRVTGATIWHINSDEPRVLDYKDGDLSTPDAFRSSDHDPIIVGLKLRGGRR